MATYDPDTFKPSRRDDHWITHENKVRRMQETYHTPEARAKRANALARLMDDIRKPSEAA